MTKAQMRNHILQQIGVLGAGQTATSEDAVYIEQIIDNCQDELEHLEVALWTVDDIPGYAVEPFTMYCASTVAAFGNEPNLVQREIALRQLRRLTADRRHGVGKAEYY